MFIAGVFTEHVILQAAESLRTAGEFREFTPGDLYEARAHLDDECAGVTGASLRAASLLAGGPALDVSARQSAHLPYGRASRPCR